VITLLVTPPEAAKLAMASTQGKIQLALRNTIDTKVTEPAAVLEATLFSGAPAPKHASVSHGPAPYVIEVIAGTKHENKSFAN
jgi:Flp pilus assembly protein CpaB